jgi:hypothetical protein
VSEEPPDIERMLIELDKQDAMNRESRKLASERGMREEVAEADRLLAMNVPLRELCLSVLRRLTTDDATRGS